MAELTASMTDEDILAHYRLRYPYISMGTAKDCYRTWIKFRHLGAIAEKKRREAVEEKRRRLQALVSGKAS